VRRAESECGVRRAESECGVRRAESECEVRRAARVSKVWPALVLRTDSSSPDIEQLLPATLDEFSPVAIEDLTPLPLPPGGLWDPSFPPPPEPPPSPLYWRVFFDSVSARDAAARAVTSAYATISIRAVEIPDDDWAARSQRDLKAIPAGVFVIAPPWDIPNDLTAGTSLIVINPARGFGTGHHASTRLCLRALSQCDVRGASVLDLGTGSGVLAMAARLRGASDVTAVDVDSDAIESARESAALNPSVSPIAWRVADFRDGTTLRQTKWDVVLANLTGGMLISSAQIIRTLLRPSSGRLIASGFDKSEREGVEAALALKIIATFEEEGWIGVILGA
jgi:ribosomal protein L11 methyltransferase